jgi:hypothetical protein
MSCDERSSKESGDFSHPSSGWDDGSSDSSRSREASEALVEGGFSRSSLDSESDDASSGSSRSREWANEGICDSVTHDKGEEDESEAEEMGFGLFDDAAPIVLDIGTSSVKAGFAGETLPRAAVASVVGRPPHAGLMVGMGQKDAYIGAEIAPSMGGALRDGKNQSNHRTL